MDIHYKSDQGHSQGFAEVVPLNRHVAKSGWSVVALETISGSWHKFNLMQGFRFDLKFGYLLNFTSQYLLAIRPNLGLQLTCRAEFEPSISGPVPTLCHMPVISATCHVIRFLCHLLFLSTLRDICVSCACHVTKLL